MAGAKARTTAAQLAVIGILPTLRHRHLVEDCISPDERYLLLNEQMLDRARGEPIRLDISRRRPARVAPAATWSPTSTRSPPRRRARRCSCTCRCPRGFAGLLERRAVPGRACSWPSARTPRSCSARGCGPRPGSRCSSSRATCAPRAAQPGRAARGCGSASVDHSVLDLFAENSRYFPA
jgi:hypothetical protein